MRVSTKTTVYLDGTELRDIIAAHLREEGALPKGANFVVHLSLGREVTQADVGKRPGLSLDDRDCARVQVEWPTQTGTPTVGGRVGS